MNKPNINLGLVLDLINDKIIVNDITDYTALGLSVGDINITLQIETPLGILYVNSNYETPNTAPDLFGTTRTFEYAPLPLLSNGCFIAGEYKLTAKLLHIPTDEVFDYNFSQNIDYKAKDLKIEHQIDCFCGNFSSIDNTNYSGECRGGKCLGGGEQEASRSGAGVDDAGGFGRLCACPGEHGRDDGRRRVDSAEGAAGFWGAQREEGITEGVGAGGDRLLEFGELACVDGLRVLDQCPFGTRQARSRRQARIGEGRERRFAGGGDHDFFALGLLA